MGRADELRNTILVGDVREQLKRLPDESVHMVVTSPPYWLSCGLRDYGTASWEGGDDGCDHRQQLGGEGQSSAKQNTSTGTQTVAYRDACGKCGAIRIDSQLGLEPTPDCGRLCGECYVCRIVAVFREVRRVLRKDGTCWINLGDSYTSGDRATRDPGLSVLHPAQPKGTARAATPPGLKPKDLVGIPWRVAFALQADGWWLRSAITWCKSNPMPESVTDRPTKATEMVFLLSKSARYFYDAEAVRIVADHVDSINSRQEGLFEESTSAAVGLAAEGSKVAADDQAAPYLVLATLLAAKRVLVEQRHDLFGQLFDAFKSPDDARARWPALRVLVGGTSKILAHVFEDIGIVITECDRDGKSKLSAVSVAMPCDDGSLAVKQAGEVVAKIRRNAQRIRQAIPLNALTEGFINVYVVDEAIAFFERTDLDAGYVGDGVVTEAALEQLNLAHGARSSQQAGTVVSHNRTIIPSGANLRDWWDIATEPFASAHFAVYPTALVKRCIQAGTSEHGCCSECGAPWARQVEVDDPKGRLGKGYHDHSDDLVVGQRGVPDAAGAPIKRTVGWKPTCKHDALVERCVVLDPFSGAATTALVALQAGRDFIGIELNPAYVEMGNKRIAPYLSRLL